MEYYLERLERELKRILNFWMQNALSKENATLYPQISNAGIPDKLADTGSLYLSRIIFGASAASRHLKTNEYKILADLAFKSLYENFRNPAGGFYWARKSNNEIMHDCDNINMAQSFILSGLAEYVELTGNPIVNAEIKKLLQFIVKTTQDTKDGGYLDGFNVDWKQEKNFTKSLATHLHLMEALVNHFQHNKDKQLIPIITEILEIILNKFIDSNNYNCYNKLSTDWNVLSDEISAGHNAEVAWLITHTAKTIDNNNLYTQACQISKKLTEKVIEQAFDKNYGGVFNRIKDGAPAENHKFWWPQAESALACMNVYCFSKDKVFLSYGLRQLEYIENTFSDPNLGEWYAKVLRDGKPDDSEPKIYFWKSLFHNVRYCIEMSRMIKSLIR